MDHASLLIYLWMIFIVSLIVYSIYSRKQTISRNKSLIESSYKAHKIEGGFDPLLALIVRDRYEELGRNGSPVQLHRICRSNGAYFLFICTSGEVGYFTQLSPDRVINALRSTPEILQKEFPNVS